jgi:RNA recognition motif-containing protein
MSAEETALKKEKKKHKSKKQKLEQDGATETEPKDSTAADAVEKKTKKRKREAIPEELEIDVSLPEPPSKKALRKSKKSKTAAATTEFGDKTRNDETNREGGSSAPTSSKSHAKTKDEDQTERRTEHSIWIGNLPWTATKQDLRDFLCDQGTLQTSQIVRLHLPAPPEKVAQDTRGRPAFKNRGFAYVDFDGPEALFSALQLTETPFYRSGRNVLVKNAKSFEGRPEEHAAAAKEKGGPAGNLQKPPSKRVFVGNLAFETTKDDLQEHYGQCGEVANIHMATFEDSGNCKGYAWVTYASLEAAEAAVRGYITKEPENEDDDGEEDVTKEADDDEAKPKRKKKGRKWYVNRLFGRELKCEYAEDASVRYKKRYGGEKKRPEIAETNGEAVVAEGGDQATERKTGHDRRREQRRAQKQSHFKLDARTIAPGAALANAPRSTGAIAEAKGKKVTFD